MNTLNNWFHLKDGRKSFKPNPVRDKHVMFCHQDVEQNITMAIEKAYATGETVKMLLWGDWGVGKTHTLRHIDYWFASKSADFPARTIYIEIGDVEKNSNFGIIHSDLLDAVGLEQVISLVYDFVRRGSDVPAELDKIGIPPGIRDAFNKMLVAAPGSAPPELVVTAWNFLRGEDVGAKGVALGLPRCLSDSKEFYYVLCALGHIVQQVTGAQLIFLVDEAAKLEAVEAVEQVTRHWVNVNKLIFDQDNSYFGFIYTVSGRGPDELPAAIYEPQIQNRLGNRRIELKNLPAKGVRDFLVNLTKSFVDKEAVKAEGIAADLETYPFEPTAFERFVDFFHRSQENSKPRDIAEKLDDAAFYALKANKKLIDEAILQELEL